MDGSLTSGALLFLHISMESKRDTFFKGVMLGLVVNYFHSMMLMIEWVGYILYELSPVVHLTNDAVQKKSKDYGKYETCNKLSFLEFDKYLDTLEVILFKLKIL